MVTELAWKPGLSPRPRGRNPFTPWAAGSGSDKSGTTSLSTVAMLRPPTVGQPKTEDRGDALSARPCRTSVSLGRWPLPFSLPVASLPQESEGVSCHYWSLFDGHAGSGAAVVASRLLQHHVTEQLQDIVEILKNSAVLPPTCLGEEPENTPANSRTLTRAASLRGGVGAPGSPSTPPTRFFTEKKIPHECLVIGALESAFKEMVGIAEGPGRQGAGVEGERESQAFNQSLVSWKLPYDGSLTCPLVVGRRLGLLRSILHSRQRFGTRTEFLALSAGKNENDGRRDSVRANRLFKCTYDCFSFCRLPDASWWYNAT